MTGALRHLGTGRNVIVALGVVAVLWLLSHFIMVPAYRAVAAGLIPMDMQFPLSREMVAFQRGAFSSGAAEAYFRFASLDGLRAVAMAIFTTLLWTWLGLRLGYFVGPVVMMTFLLPFLTALFDIVENFYFMRLVMATRGDPQHDLTILTLGIHGVTYALGIIATGITLGLITLTLVATFRRRGQTQ